MAFAGWLKNRKRGGGKSFSSFQLSIRQNARSLLLPRRIQREDSWFFVKNEFFHSPECHARIIYKIQLLLITLLYFIFVSFFFFFFTNDPYIFFINIMENAERYHHLSILIKSPSRGNLAEHVHVTWWNVVTEQMRVFTWEERVMN